jgi:phospholipase C
MLVVLLAPLQPPVTAAQGAAGRVNYLIIIYEENHAFDNYFGMFPGADGLADASAMAVQVDKQGRPYDVLPPVLANPVGSAERLPDLRFAAGLPNRPFPFREYVPPTEFVPTQIHAFYRQQYQIDGGKMDRFVAWTDAGAAPMGYWDTTALPLYRLARDYTLADHFFQGAFGGSFLTHMWLVCACTPTFPNAPADILAIPFPDDPDHLQDRAVTPDGYVVNTSQSVNTPHAATMPVERLVPNQADPTIGDRLSAAGVSWAWYSGGWNDAIAGRPDPTFAFHHQPFAFFASYADGTPAKAQHLRDETDFLAALRDGRLPAVSFVKPLGIENEHPATSTVSRGEQHLDDLVRAVQASRYWSQAAIIVTYDENGGYWDHVAPPVADRWGPGTRVPTVIVSPFARRGFVDHTVYDTTSILALIETRWGLAPLGTRDAAANNLTNAFVPGTFAPARLPQTGGEGADREFVDPPGADPGSSPSTDVGEV